MAKKLIKVMDTSFRDGFQSIYGAKVLVEDFLPALEAAVPRPPFGGYGCAAARQSPRQGA